MAHSLPPCSIRAESASRGVAAYYQPEDTRALDLLAGICVLIQNGIEPKDESDLELLSSLSNKVPTARPILQTQRRFVKPIGVELRDKLLELDIERDRVVKVPEARVLDKWFEDFTTTLNTSPSSHDDEKTHEENPPTSYHTPTSSKTAFINLVNTIREHYRQKLLVNNQVNEYYTELRDELRGTMHEQCRKRRDESSLLTPEQKLKDMAIEREGNRKKLRDAERIAGELREKLHARQYAEMNGAAEYEDEGGIWGVVDEYEDEGGLSYYGDTQDGGYSDGAGTAYHVLDDNGFCLQCYENGAQQATDTYTDDETEDDDCDTEMEYDGSLEEDEQYSHLPSTGMGYEEDSLKAFHDAVARPIKGSKQADTTGRTRTYGIKSH